MSWGLRKNIGGIAVDPGKSTEKERKSFLEYQAETSGRDMERQ